MFLKIGDRFGRSQAQKNTYFLCMVAVFVAIGFLLNAYFSYQVPGLGRVSLVYAFLYLSGMIFGPVYGFGIAFLADLLGWIIAPQGPYVVLIGISNGLTASITGAVFMLKIKNDTYKDMFIAALTLLCLFVMTSVFYHRSMDNAYRTIIIAVAGTLLVFGLYKTISFKTTTEEGEDKPQWLLKLILSAIIAFPVATLGLSAWALVILGIFPTYQAAVFAYTLSQPFWIGLNVFLVALIVPALNRAVFKHAPIQ
jgi:ECF transporter S component (folate family)